MNELKTGLGARIGRNSRSGAGSEVALGAGTRAGHRRVPGENRIERVIGSRDEAHQLRSLHAREPPLDDSSDDVDAVSGAQLEESLEPIPIKARSLTAPVLADVSAGAIFPRGSV